MLCLYGGSSFSYGTLLGIYSFLLFVRLCMKFNIFFAFIKLYFLKTIRTLYNVSIIRLYCAFHLRLCLDHRLKAHAS